MNNAAHSGALQRAMISLHSDQPHKISKSFSGSCTVQWGKLCYIVLPPVQ